MSCTLFVQLSQATQARAARGEIEAGLDVTSWRWSCSASRWIDALIVAEEVE